MATATATAKSKAAKSKAAKPSGFTRTKARGRAATKATQGFVTSAASAVKADALRPTGTSYLKRGGILAAVCLATKEVYDLVS